MEGYAPGGARRASATRSQEVQGETPAASFHLSGAGKEGTGAHQCGAEQAVKAQPAALCTGTNADTCTPIDTGSDAIAGRLSFSSSRRYGRNSLNGLRGSGATGGSVTGCGTGGGDSRRTERSMGSVAGVGTGICIGIGVICVVGLSVAGGGDGNRALSGEPAAYGGGDGAGCGARLRSAARKAGSACSHFWICRRCMPNFLAVARWLPRHWASRL